MEYSYKPNLLQSVQRIRLTEESLEVLNGRGDVKRSVPLTSVRQLQEFDFNTISDSQGNRFTVKMHDQCVRGTIHQSEIGKPHRTEFRRRSTQRVRPIRQCVDGSAEGGTAGCPDPVGQFGSSGGNASGCRAGMSAGSGGAVHRERSAVSCRPGRRTSVGGRMRCHRRGHCHRQFPAGSAIRPCQHHSSRT